jgi:DNA mismatch repair protein MutS
MAETTPMMRQYNSIKAKHRDAILFFRLGDFYEMFHSDAKEASRILGLTLTSRHGYPMCGIPYHASQGYIARLLKAGRKIAVCEQTSLPSGGKGIATREVVEIITPGTVVDEDFLDRGTNNYVVAIGKYRDTVPLSYVDLSTASFSYLLIPYDRRAEGLREHFARLGPREIIVQESLLEEDPVTARVIEERGDVLVNRFPDWSFDLDGGAQALCRQFGVGNLKAFGIHEGNPAPYVAGTLLEYVADNAKTLLPHITSIEAFDSGQLLGLDESSQRNLEIVRNLQDGGKSYTLLDVVDYTKTAMGARLLRTWLLAPLRRKADIEKRHAGVERLYRNQMALSGLQDSLGRVLDMERLTARVAMGKAHGKDLVSLRLSLEEAGRVAEILSSEDDLPDFSDYAPVLGDLAELLAQSIDDAPSILLTEGNIIRDGWNEELDRLRKLKADSRRVLEEYLEGERATSGIANLKIKYNKIIGHFLEVTKANLSSVPDHFIRRQSLVGSERYTTQRLGELESEINGASATIIDLEKSLFLEIRDRVATSVPMLLELSARIAELDCLGSFAYAATVRGYVRPRMRDSGSIRIRGGRHPVVEAHLPPGDFIPNDVDLDAENTSFALITGPNMAGKSTYLRQVALIVLLAQAGSFVPADEADVGTVDKIFCRVGASDNLARGESTFLVEMNETAHILRTATDRSLVIMDEVGRGTGTNDGLSIAWAVSEYLMDVISARTLFATHYHELTRLENEKMVNLSMMVVEDKGAIVFLKKIRHGVAGDSYGIHVATLAGLPEAVVRAAEARLRGLAKEPPLPEPVQDSKAQGELFSTADMALRELRSFKVDDSTPLEALMAIKTWQDLLES